MILGQRTRTVSYIQKKLIINFLETNPNLISAKFSSNFRFKDAQLKWLELANTLNRVPGGRKGWREWRKTWHDLRSKAKQKYHQENTLLSDIEKEIVQLTGEFQPIKKDEIYAEEANFKTEDTYEDSSNNLDLEQFLMENSVNEDLSIQNSMENIIIEYLPSKTSNIASEERREEHSANGDNLDELQEEINQVVEDKNSSNFHGSSIDRKPKLKRTYYERKLHTLNRIARAKEKSAAARERIADALEKMVDFRTSLI